MGSQFYSIEMPEHALICAILNLDDFEICTGVLRKDHFSHEKAEKRQETEVPNGSNAAPAVVAIARVKDIRTP